AVAAGEQNQTNLEFKDPQWVKR
ncbi:hypothetical protein A2U01_0117284, partial [Trifolium medium]|nr:hypothetical protein [Trifolium medium]